MKKRAYKNSNGASRKTGGRPRLVPLIAGAYGTFLGLGLTVIGLSEIREGLGLIRLLIGLGITGFGLFGVWDGVRDVIRPERQAETPPDRQFILTDMVGNRSSRITLELLRKQMDIFAEAETLKGFDIQILPPLAVEEHGLLKQVLWIHPDTILLAAFFETPEGEFRILQSRIEPDPAAEWLKGLLAGNPDFSQWESMEAVTGQAEAAEQRARPTDWYQRLSLFGESWHDEHKFFSARDVELAAEGIHEGRYLKAVLELGAQAIELFPGLQNDLLVVWRTNNTPDGESRFLAKTGTVTQVKFWLVNYLYHGLPGEMSGWSDVTEQIRKEEKRGVRSHGEVF